MPTRQPSEDDEQSEDRLVIDKAIDGADEFNGRPDGKVGGRGMLGLVSAIPPAPNIPQIKGVRMLAPSIPSERPGRAPLEASPPRGNFNETEADELRFEEADAPDPRAQSGVSPKVGPEGRPLWATLLALVVIAAVLASIPAALKLFSASGQ